MLFQIQFTERKGNEFSERNEILKWLQELLYSTYKTNDTFNYNSIIITLNVLKVFVTITLAT